jgi:CHRD domain/PEP-CTERM motif
MRLIHSLPVAAALLYACVSPSQAATVFVTSLAGANEVPARVSPGSGFARVTIDNAMNNVRIVASFSNLTTPTVAGHIHCCVPSGVNGPIALAFDRLPGFPLGVTSGVFDLTLNLLDQASYGAGFFTNNGGGTVAGARSAFLSGIAAGNTYVNIHTSRFPGGELRGQLAQIPEPESWAMLIVGFGLIGSTLRRRARITVTVLT